MVKLFKENLNVPLRKVSIIQTKWVQLEGGWQLHLGVIE